jgi:PKD repeat protein
MIKLKLFKHILTLSAISLMFIQCSDDEGQNLGVKPVADFTADDDDMTVEVGTVVTFTDASSNEPFLYTWRIPGGNPTYDNKSSVAVEFLAEGDQPVTLTVRNDAGADEITKTVKVNPLVIPDLEGVTPTVKMTFDSNLENSGSVGGTGTGGSSSYEPRSKYGGMALKLNGTSGQDVVLNDYTGVNGGNARTVACWIKTDATSIAGLVHWGASGTYSRASFKLQNTGVIRFEWQGGGMNGTTSVNDNNWHHVAYTYDGNVVNLYVDGVLDATVATTAINTGVAGETGVYIGSQLGGSVYSGLIDDVRIYESALNVDQISFLAGIH